MNVKFEHLNKKNLFLEDKKKRLKVKKKSKKTFSKMFFNLLIYRVI